jgi:hypothetical protein
MHAHFSSHKHSDRHVRAQLPPRWGETTSNNRPVAYPPRDIWAWRNTEQGYRQGKTPDSSTRALWQSYQQDHLTGEENDEFCRTKSLFPTSEGHLTCRRILRHEAHGFTFSRSKVSAHFIALENPSPSAGFKPVNLVSNGYHANQQTTEDDILGPSIRQRVQSSGRMELLGWQLPK